MTRIDERGANLRDEALLGHNSLATTAHYTHVDSERLRTLVGNFRRHSVTAFLFPISQGSPQGESVGEIAAMPGRAASVLGKEFTVDGLRAAGSQ